MSSFTILLGGELVRTPRLDAQVAGSRVLAADGGIGHAALLGVVPELWVGDFDSVPRDLPERLRTVERRSFPADKDQTDGELAVSIARGLGARRLLLAGAFGGPRADHAFLHMALGLRLAEAGVPAVLSSGTQEGMPLLPGRTAFDYAPGTLFSVLAFSDLEGLTVSGAKWPLDRIRMSFGSSLTLSNEVSGPLGIGLERGRAMLLAHPAAGVSP